LLYIHDHLINAIGSQKVSCLCLLDLSAAIDTIDHNILITRLSSWFGINGSVLSWFKSYISSCSFHVKCDNNLLSFHSSSCGVPQGSVLGHLLFLVYTTPLSTLISSLSFDHHLYADDTQLCFFFHPLNLDSASLKHLLPSKRFSTYLFLVSWMTANLTLNSSNTKFLLSVLKKQLDKIQNSFSLTYLLTVTYRGAEIAKTPQQRRLVFESHCERRKRYVFSFVLNVASDMFWRKAGGRLFHTAGPLYAKLRCLVEI